MDHKDCALPHLTTEVNFTTMGLHNLLGDCQTQTCAVSFATGTSWIYLIEPLEEMGQRFVRDTYACILGGGCQSA